MIAASSSFPFVSGIYFKLNIHTGTKRNEKIKNVVLAPLKSKRIGKTAETIPVKRKCTKVHSDIAFDLIAKGKISEIITQVIGPNEKEKHARNDPNDSNKLIPDGFA